MKKSTLYSVLIIFLSIIIIFFSVCYLILPQKSFSDNENRVLQVMPNFSAEKLWNGEFSRQLHSYLTDQIALREKMIEIKAICNLVLGRRENNGVILAKDSYLIERYCYTEKNYEFLQSNLNKIERLTDKLNGYGTNIISVLIPRKEDVLVSKLPSIHSNERCERIWELVSSSHLLLLESFKNSQDLNVDIYYKTDHHWTNDGAYCAYVFLSEHLGFSPLSIEDFNLMTISNEFYGTSYSKSGFFFTKPDAIICPELNADRYKTIIMDTGKSLDGIWDFDYLSTKDKYSVFLSGNNAHVKITDMQDTTKDTLLLIKDSFSHSLVPYLLMHYNLELIDPRYYSGSIEKYITENNINNVLFLLWIDTLSSSNISIR